MIMHLKARFRLLAKGLIFVERKLFLGVGLAAIMLVLLAVIFFVGAATPRVVLGIGTLGLLFAIRIAKPQDSAVNIPTSTKTTEAAASFERLLQWDAAVLIGCAHGQGSAAIGEPDKEREKKLNGIIEVVGGRDQSSDDIVERLREILGVLPPAGAGEFVYDDARHEALYSHLGVVEDGHVVKVVKDPVVVQASDGTVKVIKKGLVSKKK